MRRDHPLGNVVGLVVAGMLASGLSVAVDGAPVAAVPLWGAVLAAAAAALAVVLRVATRSRLSSTVASTVASWLVLLCTVADAAYQKIFDAHVDRDTLVLGWDAWRTSIFHFGVANVLAASGAAVVLLALLHAVFRLANRLPRPEEAREQTMIRFARAAAAALALVVVFRDLVLPGDARWTRPLFWHHPLVQRELRERAAASTGVHFGEGLVDIETRALGRIDADLRQGHFEVTTERRPDIVLVHVESLRSDMLTAERMPKLFAWSKRCATSPQHYSTSNATGGGAFGALTGLTATYHASSRRDHILPIPLRVLAKLGYERRVWFPNDALVFDHLRDFLFGDLAEERIVDREPVDEADALTVDHFVHELDATRSAPRFDYVVIDSSHFDYAYPPSFAKHLPVAGLAPILNRRTGEGKVVFEHGDAEERRTGGIFNRYLNSVLYVDSLVDRMLVALEQRARLDGTIVVVFGDHGEAFWDKEDTFGHSSALVDAQTRVPIVLCTPPRITNEYRVTSHADIFPTVFDLLGIRAERPFMTGKSLARHVPGLDYAILRFPVTSAKADPRHAIVLDGFKIAYLDETDPRALWVRDANDDRVNEPSDDLVTRALATVVSAKLLREPRGL